MCEQPFPHLDNVAVWPPVFVQGIGARPLRIAGRGTRAVTISAAALASSSSGRTPLARLLGLTIPTSASAGKRLLLLPHQTATASGLLHDGRHGGG